MNKTISANCNNSSTDFGRISRNNNPKTMAQVAAAYQIEEIKNKCDHSLPPGESFYGIVVTIDYDIEEVKRRCKKIC